MSMHTYTTIGVYVECVNRYTETQVTKTGCVNEACKNYHVSWVYPSSYCSACGHAVFPYSVTEQKPVIDVWQLTDDMEEQMMPALMESKGRDSLLDTWLPNVGQGVEIDGLDADKSVELTPLMRSRHLENFEQFYGDALAVLLRAYGPHNVTVKWGVVVETR